MKRIYPLYLIAIFLISLLSFPAAAQDVTPPTQEEMNTLLEELPDVQAQNEHLGPDHDSVYPGDSLFFSDGSAVAIPDGSYESLELLKVLRAEGYEVPVTIIRHDEVSEEPRLIEAQSEAGLPGWLLPWLIILTVVMIALGVSIWLMGRKLIQIHRDMADDYNNTREAIDEAERKIRAMVQEPITDDAEVFEEGPFRNPDEERTPSHVYRDMNRLAHIHFSDEWDVIKGSIERGIVRAPDLSMFQYNPHGEITDRQHLGRVEVTGYRALARNRETGDEQYIIALARCMNKPVREDEEDIEFIPQEEIDVHPLIGTTAEIVDVEEADNSTTLTLEHPDIDEDILYVLSGHPAPENGVSEQAVT